MSDIALLTHDLGKQYRIGGRQERYRTLRDTLMDTATSPLQAVRSLLGGQSPSRRDDETIWALQDVSCEIRRGEVVGIIGRNGAGKSTLLKILSRITGPTTGSAEIHGRVGSLLEVGTGFHPELSGRDNIFLNGAILGMSRREICRQFDAIVDFAEIDKFLDTPVKRYSSGMYVRLAFAVAAHLSPEILIVDEVLAVGDALFQKKCLGKMEAAAEQEGRTVLFVSHNMSAVQRLCGRVIWLEGGKLVRDGQPGAVIRDYLRAAHTDEGVQYWPDPETAPGNETVRLRRVAVRPENGFPDDPITVRTPFVMEFEFWNREPGAYLNLSVHVFNQEGTMVFNTAPVKEPVWHGKPFPAGLFCSRFRVPCDLLNDGTYRVQLLAIRNEAHLVCRFDDVLVFDIEDSAEARGAWQGKWPGVVRPALEWRTEQLGDSVSAAPASLTDPITREVEAACASTILPLEEAA